MEMINSFLKKSVFTESNAKFLGAALQNGPLTLIKKKVSCLEVSENGSENLLDLADKPYILVGPHLMPDCSDLERKLALAIDGLVVKRVVKQITDQDLMLLAKCDQGWLGDSKFARWLQKITAQFGEDIVNNTDDLIAVKKNPLFKDAVGVGYNFNRTLFTKIDSTLSDNRPILIFPDGSWVNTFAQKGLRPGAAHFALRNNLPLVPFWMTRMSSILNSSQKVEITFGEKLMPKGSKKDLTQEIEHRIKSLAS